MRTASSAVCHCSILSVVEPLAVIVSLCSGKRMTQRCTAHLSCWPPQHQTFEKDTGQGPHGPVSSGVQITNGSCGLRGEQLHRQIGSKCFASP